MGDHERARGIVALATQAEIEKAFAGLGAEGDSGVATRLFGTILTWLSDREDKGSQVFFLATANDASRLPPEFSRAERFDGVFFIDLPRSEERSLIWRMYGELYGLSHEQQYGSKEATFSDKNWTGAEIRSCCRLAKALRWPLSRAAKNVVPVAATAGEKIKALREWARNRVLSADYEGVYQGEAQDMYAEESKRKVKRKDA